MAKMLWESKKETPIGLVQPRTPSASSNTKRLWRLREFTDAKLFLHPDRATLTFYYQGSVASIHFDLSRGEIFFKGHNVRNLKLTEEEWNWLQGFGYCLQEEGAGEDLTQDYERHLREVLPS